MPQRLLLANDTPPRYASLPSPNARIPHLAQLDVLEPILQGKVRPEPVIDQFGLEIAECHQQRPELCPRDTQAKSHALELGPGEQLEEGVGQRFEASDIEALPVDQQDALGLREV